MLLQEERKQIVEYGKRLVKYRLTRGTGGNISIFNKEKELMAISPSGMNYFEIEPGDVVVMDLDGKIADGTRKPSSEYEMHRIFYLNREGIGAAVHTHSTYSTVLSCMHWPIPSVHYLVAYAGMDVPCAEYASFGTKEIADKAFAAMGDRNAVLLANHGMLAVGPDLPAAFNTAEETEFCAEIYYRTKCVGQPVLLPDDEMKRMIERFKTYGQK